MKILLINQFFWPDSSATSQQLTQSIDRLDAILTGTPATTFHQTQITAPTRAS